MNRSLFSFCGLLFTTAIALLFVMPAHMEIPLPGRDPLVLERPVSTLSFGQVQRDLELKQGLDIQGGTQITLKAIMDEIAVSDRTLALQTAREVIERRINLYGVNEASVQTSTSGDEHRLLVEIPGVQGEKARNLIGSTAQLDFREYTPSTQSATLATISGYLVQDFASTGLSGKDLSRASVEFDPTTGQPVISLTFSPDGTKKFAAVTKRNIGKPVSIFLDDYPITSPIVQNEIIDGKAQISGDFTVEQAKSLSIALNAGALPVPITILSQKSVGPTLGADAIARSVRAGVVGLVIVATFMVALYGGKGFLSVLSLLFYGVVTLLIYKLVPVTLTLAGIAGFLLSMGMAVDTNILVFERLKEEERKKMLSMRTSVSRAFARTWNSIRDANATTLITCFVLYNPFDWSFLNRSGMVRGFALTLAIGILVNLISGMIVTRILMDMFYSSKGEE